MRLTFSWKLHFAKRSGEISAQLEHTSLAVAAVYLLIQAVSDKSLFFKPQIKQLGW